MAAMSKLDDQKELPQPQNSNHPSTTALKDKLLVNSTYLAAEIPSKLGHFVQNLWQSTGLKSHETIWLLGQPYRMVPEGELERALFEAQKEHQEVPWPADFYEDFTSRLWMTYRHHYPPIRPSSHQTDIGWGCMLRSGQSLLANTFLLHFLGRDWRRSDTLQWKEYSRIAHWFLDELSPRAPFSIHRIALLGKQLGKNIGEWFGPSTISQVIQALVSDYAPAQLSVYVAPDGVIYQEEVIKIAHGQKPTLYFSQDREAQAIYDAHRLPSGKSPTQGSFQPTLILVALRLGIDSLHPSYHAALKACFRMPHCVGIAGGRPNSSLYFMGTVGEEDLIYLDPHYSRPALETKSLAEYTPEDFATYHCPLPRKIPLAQIDPSMLIGFYCRNQQAFDEFCWTMTKVSKENSAIITIQTQAPAYDEDVRSENDFGVLSDEQDEFGE
ncbi:hypothetical protein BY458DRAFT_461724 [Sporodiniella umbellata]|nr:hypothetical protein BY458DRAFT_461724 [Sporodiniella umbellata]